MSEEFEEGHEFVYRVTSTGGRSGHPESSYYVSAHKAQFWRDQLRLTGYSATASRVPAESFEFLDDDALDELAEEERDLRA